MINLAALIVLSLPCALGFNLLSSFQPLGEGSTVLDLEDFLVSNVILPIGALCYLLFTGEGLKLPRQIRVYVTYILPVLLFFLIVKGLIDRF